MHKFNKFRKFLSNLNSTEATLFFSILFFISVCVLFRNNINEIVQSELRSLSLLPKSELYTELYFLGHQHLPVFRKTGEPVVFSFVIHNKEDKAILYLYGVYVEDKNSKVLINQSEVLINKNESVTIQESLIFNSVPIKPIIYVLLQNNQQEIHFKLLK